MLEVDDDSLDDDTPTFTKDIELKVEEKQRPSSPLLDKTTRDKIVAMGESLDSK